MPTLLGLCGAADGAPKDVQGRDLSPALLGEDIDRPGSGLYMFMQADDPAGGNRGVRTHRYTLAVCCRKDGTEETFLHDNQEDPYQLRNIAAERPEVVAELTAEMNRRLERTGDPWMKK
jgi:arylsulfatase A-like enzyme